MRGWLRVVGTLAIALGAGCLSYVATVLLQAREHRSSYRRDVAAPRVAGAAIGEIRIARVGLQAVITEGDSDAILDLGPGHLSDTPWIDEPGNVVIAGHRDTSFRPLRNVRAGDEITVTAHNKAARYRIASMRIVLPSDLSVLTPESDNTLTLVTCYPFGFIGNAPKRFIVRAVEIR